MKKVREGYKMTELGEIPKEWEVTTLEKISEFITKGATPTTYGYDWVDDGILFLRSDCVTDNGFRIGQTMKISEEANEVMKRSEITSGDLLISITGNIGRVGVVPDYIKKANINQHVARVRINNGASARYLYYQLSRSDVRKNFEKIKTGLAYPQISLEQVRNTKVFLPSIKEQEKIASILSIVDEQIDVVDGLIENNKELKKGLMQQLLTKGIGHTKFKKSEVGDIPEEWEVKKLYEVCAFSNGKAHESDISENGKYIVVNSKFIATEGVVKKYSDQNICPLSKGDIVMVMSDVPNGRAIGKCYLINEDNRYTLNQRICSLKTLNMDNEFLFYYLNRNKYFLKYDDGVKQTNLRKDEVLDCQVVIPSLNEQKKIAEILSSVNLKIEFYETKKQKLEEIKKGLMQQLLTGKSRVV